MTDEITKIEVATKAVELQKMLIAARAGVPPGLQWQQILAACSQSENLELSAIDFELWSRLAGDHVEEIVAAEPLPDDLAFVYFGLYDSLDGRDSADKARVGFYFAGGASPNCEDAIENGDLSYFPTGRRIHIDVLDRIRNAGRKTPEQQLIFDWLLLWAAAAVLAKSAITRLEVQMPTFVGFDSGDYFQVAG
jgi:hypothetical protein